jgi:hypothetical protein
MEKLTAEMTGAGVEEGRLVKLPDSTLLSRTKYDRMKSGLENIINVYHDANPLADGIPRQELLSRLKESWHTEDDKLLQGAVRYLMDSGVIEDHGKSIALSGFRIEYTPEQLSLKNRIAGMYAEAGLEMIRTDDVMALDNSAPEEEPVQTEQPATELASHENEVELDPEISALLGSLNDVDKGLGEHPRSFLNCMTKDVSLILSTSWDLTGHLPQ